MNICTYITLFAQVSKSDASALCVQSSLVACSTYINTTQQECMQARKCSCSKYTYWQLQHTIKKAYSQLFEIVLASHGDRIFT